MIVNSTKIELAEKIRVIDLFAGIGGLSVGLQKAYKKNCIRMSVGRDDFLWNQCSSIAKEDEHKKAIAYHDNVEPKLDTIRYEIDKLEREFKFASELKAERCSL